MLKSTVSHWDSFWEKKSLLPIIKFIEELEKLTSLNQKSVIEIGAGSGTTALEIAKHCAKVTCLDYSPASIKLISKNYDAAKQSRKIIAGDAYRLPIKNRSYDICYHQGFLEHFRDISPILKEQHRILKDDGLILIDVPQTFNFYTVKKHYLMARKKWFAGWETEFTHRELKLILEKHGFSYVQGFGRFHTRHLDRIQIRFLKREVLPRILERLYYRLICKIENSFFGKNTAFAVGVIARKIE